MSQPKKGNKMVAKVVATTFATHFYMSQLWLQPLRPSPKVATSIPNSFMTTCVKITRDGVYNSLCLTGTSLI